MDPKFIIVYNNFFLSICINFFKVFYPRNQLQLNFLAFRNQRKQDMELVHEIASDKR